MEEIFYIAFRIISSNFALFFKGYLGLCTACLKAKKQLLYNMSSLWRKKWHPTPVFLPGESHRQGSLAGYSPRGQQESDTTEPLNNNDAESHSAMTAAGIGRMQDRPSILASLSVWAQKAEAAGGPRVWVHCPQKSCTGWRPAWGQQGERPRANQVWPAVTLAGPNV